MTIERVATESAPSAIGPYSQAIRCGEFIYCSGQIALDPGTGELVGDDVASQTRQVLKNLAAVLAASGSSFGSLVKTTVYLTRMADFGAMNEVYAELVPSRPARACVAVSELPKGAQVEIDAIALREQT